MTVVITGKVPVRAVRITEDLGINDLKGQFLDNEHVQALTEDEFTELREAFANFYIVNTFGGMALVHPADIAHIDPDMTPDDEHQHDWGIECRVCHLQRPPRD